MQDLKRANRSFEALATYHYDLINLTGDANHAPEALYGLFVSANLFPMLGVKPMLGRNISPEEEQIGRDQELILSYGLWTRRFASDQGVIGRSVDVNGRQKTIIGVMPAGFDFPLRLFSITRTFSQHMDFFPPRWAACWAIARWLDSNPAHAIEGAR
jgi:putative ABC transport system permease protein